MKDNRKNLKKGFVYPYTSKEEPEKKTFQRHPCQKVQLCPAGRGNRASVFILVKIYSSVDRIPLRPETGLFFTGPQHTQPTKGRGRNINNSSLDLGFSSFFFFFFRAPEHFLQKKSHQGVQNGKQTK